MIIFTSICANYIHKARCLADSVKQNIPDATFVVCLLERELKEEYKYSSFDRVILAKDSWNGNFDKFIFKHTIVEASTAVKGNFFRFLYNEYKEEDKFIYLDPDVYVYSDFVELRELLKDNNIILCPHLLQYGNIDMELSSTAHGVYNLGFLAVNNSKEAKEFIDWWANRLELYCYDDIKNGIFTDQKWIDLAPCFFDVLILKHRGYDFATWSLLNCGMYEENGEIYVKGDPLRFIHFSGFGSCIENCIENWLPEGDHKFKDLYKDYVKIHTDNDKDSISKSLWTYGNYYSGKCISDKIRYLYRKNYPISCNIDNPFDLSDNRLRRMLSINKSISDKIKENYRKTIKSYHENGILHTIKKIRDKM
ncbi:MAG: glycosyltransferase [Selenomonadaceae bacterium]|nr:glycosyltransferase [Selenomonadaceae bacterium]